MPPCLKLSIIRYLSRVKWSNPGKGVVPSPTPRCSSYWKASFMVALDYGHQLYFVYLTKPRLMGRLQYLSLGEYWLPFSLSLLSGWPWHGLVRPVTMPYINRIALFTHLLRIIIRKAKWLECRLWSRRLGLNPRLSHTKDQKMVFE